MSICGMSARVLSVEPHIMATTAAAVTTAFDIIELGIVLAEVPSSTEVEIILIMRGLCRAPPHPHSVHSMNYREAVYNAVMTLSTLRRRARAKSGGLFPAYQLSDSCTSLWLLRRPEQLLTNLCQFDILQSGLGGGPNA